MSTPATKSANAVLRSIVSPALGIAAVALVAAGAASACGSSQTAAPDDAAVGPVGLVARAVESGEPDASSTPTVAPAPSTSPSAPSSASASPIASASAAPSASTIPKPGEVAPPTRPGLIPNPGTIAPPKVGTTMERPPAAPGFSGSRFAIAAPAERPTRRTRHVTDVDATRLRPPRRLV